MFVQLWCVWDRKMMLVGGLHPLLSSGLSNTRTLLCDHVYVSFTPFLSSFCISRLRSPPSDSFSMQPGEVFLLLWKCNVLIMQRKKEARRELIVVLYIFRGMLKGACVILKGEVHNFCATCIIKITAKILTVLNVNGMHYKSVQNC